MTNPLPTHIAISPNVVFQAVHEEAVLLDLNTDQTFVLNPVGTHMWQLFAENSSTEAAIRKLMKAYEVDEATLCQDMVDWITELVKLGFASIVIDTAL